MKNIHIKAQSLPLSCEICHKADLFDLLGGNNEAAKHSMRKFIVNR